MAKGRLKYLLLSSFLLPPPNNSIKQLLLSKNYIIAGIKKPQQQATCFYSYSHLRERNLTRAAFDPNCISRLGNLIALSCL